MFSRRTVYLDHSASTPVDKRVLEVMLPYFTEYAANPSASHQPGRKAEQAIEQARQTIARILNCSSSEIVFTSGGSESDNLSIRGATWAAKQRHAQVNLVTSPIEHDAVGRTMKHLAGLTGVESMIVPVNREGMIQSADFIAACQKSPSIASLMLASNEIGTIQPITEITTALHGQNVIFHTDAVQAAGQIPLDVQALNVDLLSLSAHKFYGAKGAGLLYIRRGTELISQQTGGSHENGLRAGTQNTPLIVGMAKALELAAEEHSERVTHYQTLRDRLIDGILTRISDAWLTGHPTQRLPSHASFVFADIEANQLLMHLDMRGVAASSGSACKTGNPEPSEILQALGYDRELALSGLRLTVGKETTESDVLYAVDAVVESVAALRKLKLKTKI